MYTTYCRHLESKQRHSSRCEKHTGVRRQSITTYFSEKHFCFFVYIMHAHHLLSSSWIKTETFFPVWKTHWGQKTGHH